MSNLAENEIRGSGPNERFGVAIVRGDIVEDGLAQMRNGVEASAADRLIGDLCKPALDLVEPGGVGRNKVERKRGCRWSQRRMAGVLCVP